VALSLRLNPEERRAFPRIVIDRDILILQSDGSIVRARAYDLSPDGLKLVCDVATAQALRPPMDLDRPVRDFNHQVEFEIPLADGAGDIHAQCQVSYVKLMANKQVAVGLRFVEIIGGSRFRLERFIEESLEPR